MDLQNYLNEIQDFDDASQKQLLAEWKDGAFLDIPSMMQQTNKSLLDFFNTQNNMPLPNPLGETIRGMNNMSPLLQIKPPNNSKTSQSLKTSYFIDAQIEKKGNLSVINDLKKTAKDGFLYTSLDVFFDKNLNGIQDPDEKLMFKVYFFFSDDGNKVREAYQVSRLEESDIYFFIEGDEDFFSSKKLYAKVSPEVKKQFYNKDGELDEKFFNSSVMGTLSKETGFEADIVRELLENGNVEKENVNLEKMITALKQGLVYFFSTSKALGWACNKIGNGLDYLKISDDFWDTQSEDYFFDKDNLIKKIIISDDLINKIDKLFENKKGLDLDDITPNILEQYIKKYSGAIKRFIQYYNDFVTREIDAVYQLADGGIGEFLAGKMQLWVAFRCGLWNGIVDFISSLFKFVGEILEAPFNAVLDFQGAMETLDNIYDFLFGGHFLENLGNAATEMYNKLLDFCKTHNKEDYDWVRVSYIAGSGIAFIASFFIPFTQVLKAANLGKVAEIIQAVNKEVGAALSAASKYSKGQAYKALSALLELFSKGGKAFWNFLKNVWDELEKWFLSARFKLSKVAEFLGFGFSRETAETLGNLGLKPKTVFEQTGLGANLPYGNFVTRLEYKGFTVFKGSKKQVAAFAKELKGMSNEAAIKYLDDLLEKIFIIGERFEKHIEDGHVRIKKFKADNLVDEYEYLASQGGRAAERGFNYSPSVGGFHILNKLNNSLVRIIANLGTKILPTGETVRLAHIEYWVEEMGRWKLKPDTHTFFPSKWDINKIKKVVQEASANIIEREGNRYVGISKDGIKIEMYINPKTREIQTAYITFKKH